MKNFAALFLSLTLLSSCSVSTSINEATPNPSASPSGEKIIAGYVEEIPLVYDDAQSFSEGLAAVKKDGKWGFVDKQGEVVIPFKYDSVNAFVDGISLFGVRNGENRIDRYGYIDKTGKEIYPPVNEYSFTPPPSDKCLDDLIHDGMLKTFINGKWGFADYSGKEMVPPIYERALSYSDGIAAVRTGDHETGKWSYIDKTGKIILTTDYDKVGSFYEGLAAVCKGAPGNEKWGFIDKRGKEVIPCAYFYVDNFSNGIAGVSKNGEGTYSDGFIDKTGAFVIEPGYNLLESFDNRYFACFSEGLLAVENAAGKYGYIDVSGNLVVDYLYSEAAPFSDGMAAVRKGEYQAGKWGYINANGQEVIPCFWDNAFPFHDGVAVVWVKDKDREPPDWNTSMIDKSGKEIVTPVYHAISDASEGMAKVCSPHEDGSFGFIKLIYE